MGSRHTKTRHTVTGVRGLSRPQAVSLGVTLDPYNGCAACNHYPPQTDKSATYAATSSPTIRSARSDNSDPPVMFRCALDSAPRVVK